MDPNFFDPKLYPACVSSKLCEFITFHNSKWEEESQNNNIAKVLSTGVVTSPNYPDYYPNNLDKKETIKVDFGKILRLQFTHFAVAGDPSSCSSDYIKVTDGDGTTLMDKTCNWWGQLPSITSNTNTVEIFFHTDDSGRSTGWSLIWIAFTPGVKSLN